ncbi:YbgC/FadM family acyl-CoA thioesterase [Helicobacter sp. WB40]|uniref:YbgC/FadM family acyl-CoA thioesterase n=1 Tax=Helicobacter sp. WB40 TaxID=3004130 RepID=UPI0022EBEB44|nr:YbgC/FadM family acyl-CoA thioesterase [Helicobacter sp. WB40]MDA3966462.1 YbgC/FadM family acyl-CoA thioesterase [Helicobacter sp. WB40]
MKVRVYYEDTDCGGIVYHSNYLKYCERARSEMFFKINSSPFQNGIGFVVKNMNIDFLATAKLGDLLEVKTQLLKIKNVSVELKQTIYLENTKIFEAQILLACMDSKTSKPTKIPQWANEVFQILGQ